MGRLLCACEFFKVTLHLSLDGTGWGNLAHTCNSSGKDWLWDCGILLEFALKKALIVSRAVIALPIVCSPYHAYKHTLKRRCHSLSKITVSMQSNQTAAYTAFLRLCQVQTDLLPAFPIMASRAAEYMTGRHKAKQPAGEGSSWQGRPLHCNWRSRQMKQARKQARKWARK